MQEDEPRRHQPQLHPAALTRRVNTTRHAIMEQQRPTSPPRAQERAAGAQIYAFSPTSFYTPPVCDCVICLKFVSGFDGHPMSWSVSHFQHEVFTLLTCLFLLMHSFLRFLSAIAANGSAHVLQGAGDFDARRPLHTVCSQSLWVVTLSFPIFSALYANQPQGRDHAQIDVHGLWFVSTFSLTPISHLRRSSPLCSL